MHDPLVVALEIRRPWPHMHKVTRRPPWRSGPRWGAHWYIGGRELYFPALLTIWHREPGGRDSFEVCGYRSHWQWHVHHWRIQIPPLQTLRRRLLTRCAWCGGRENRRDAINVSHQWHSRKAPWWRGEIGLYHRDCSSVAMAHGTCLCDQPTLSEGEYGRCYRCGGTRAWRKLPTPAQRLLCTLPTGSRIPADMRPELERLWAEQRKANQS